MNEREEALGLLSGTLSERRFEERQNDELHRAFVRTLVQGVLRWRSLLDHWIAHLSGRPIDRIDPAVLEILRIGLYQIRFMQVPDYATVSETVDLAVRTAPRARGFVNAVLRKATRTDLDSLIPGDDSVDSEATRLAHPRWLLERWQQTYGSSRARAIASANQELSWPDLVAQTRRAPLERTEQTLRERGVDFERSPLVPDLLRLRTSTRPVRDLIDEGSVYPMDEGSALVAWLVPAEGRWVLDVAAAPGGKSIILALRGLEVVSHDISLERLLPLRRTYERMTGSRPRLVIGDGTKPPFGRRFPSVLLDAPCSASGIIRRHPEIKWRLSAERIARHAERQKILLRACLDLTGEECVYSTCSLEPEENDEVVRAVLEERRDFILQPFEVDAVPAGARPWIERGILRLTPDSGADGFTAFRLRRREKTR